MPLLATMQQYSLSMNEEGCQLDFLVTDLRLELLSDTVIHADINHQKFRTPTDFGKIPIPTSINTWDSN